MTTLDLAAEGLLHTPIGFARHEFVAMGCACSVVVPASRRQVARAVEQLFGHWDRVMSRFLPDSELSRVNRGGGSPVPAPGLLLDAVEEAQRAARATDGLFDPTLEPTIRHLGYDRTFAAVPPDGHALEVRRPASAWQAIVVDREQGTIQIPVGSGLDLGGIAKGMAVDAALAELVAGGVEAAMVEAGGDLAVLGRSPDRGGWRVAIDTPTGQRDVALASGALATSGVARRSWRRGGRVSHQLIDPRTGDSARSDLWSVTAFADSCTHAEVAAKVALIQGKVAGAAFLDGIGVSALFIDHVGNETAIGRWAVS